MRSKRFLLLSGLCLGACSTPASRCPAGAVCDEAGATCQSRAPSTRPGCSPDGWCALSSPAAGKVLYGIWGSSAEHVLVAGEDGVLLEWRP